MALRIGGYVCSDASSIAFPTTRATRSMSASWASNVADLHDHWLGDRDGTRTLDELRESPVNGAIGGAVVFDPGGGVGEDHATARGACRREARRWRPLRASPAPRRASSAARPGVAERGRRLPSWSPRRSGP